MSSHNAGTVLYTDIIIPIVGFVLWAGSYLTRERSALIGGTGERAADQSHAETRSA